MALTKRRAYEPGHRPKFLVVVDDTPECQRAVRFAARRAGRIGSGIVLLAVAPPADFDEWLGVGQVMQAENEAAAEARLSAAAGVVRAVAGLEPERVLRHGETSEEILTLIEADEDIALLVLGAGVDPAGPGPLVSTLAGKSSGAFPVPLAIVPGHLSDAQIDALA
jgi:nucleotide-binding universal stress UspA family protein